MWKNLFTADNSNGHVPFVQDFLSFLFILAAPYLSFIVHSDFIFEVANLFFVVAFTFIAAVLAVLLRLLPSALLRVVILTILLLIFIDIQFDWTETWDKGKIFAAIGATLFLVLWTLRTHVSQIIGVMFGTILAVTLGTLLLSYSLESNFAPTPTSEKRKASLPVYVHIVLDELIGIEGFDSNIPSHNKIRKEIETLFIENNFRVFSRAYSPYYGSTDSLTAAVNLKTTKNPERLVSHNGESFSLIKNRYFEKLLIMGYNINVYQSSYLDFCGSIRERIQSCLTYNWNAIPSAALTDLTNYEKTLLALAMYGELSFFVTWSKDFYWRSRSYLEGLGVVLPRSDWAVWMGRVGPIPTLPIFDTLIKDVAAAPGGTMFFAHILMPHFPYSVDSACKIRRPLLAWNSTLLAWKKRHFEINHADKDNSPRARLPRYEEYIAQVRCALLKMEKLLDALKTRGENTIVIVHGDHGSRIVLLEPAIENKDRLSRQDFYDAFSTLYVVKWPGISPGYDTRMMALPELLQSTVSGDINASAKFEPDTRPTVFLRDDEKRALEEVPMPYLPITNR